MYCSINFKTKSQLVAAIKDNTERIDRKEAPKHIGVFQPNGDLFGVTPPNNGWVAVEGPHYPQPHRWYARVRLEDGAIVEIKR